MNREFLASTEVSDGIAIPHARVSEVRSLRFAFGRARQSVLWGARGSAPVRFIFLMAIPSTDSTGYLALLSAFARLYRNPAWLRGLESATGARELVQILRDVSVRKGAADLAGRA
jgi:PTS system nitrogen regulatory IIA component